MGWRGEGRRGQQRIFVYEFEASYDEENGDESLRYGSVRFRAKTAKGELLKHGIHSRQD